MTSTQGASEEFRRAAKAAEAALYPLTKPGTVTLRELAEAATRAAIAAIREPTPAMTDAGHWAIREATARNGNMTTYSDGDHAWRAMIDAILSEQERAWRTDAVAAERDERARG